MNTLKKLCTDWRCTLDQSLFFLNWLPVLSTDWQQSKQHSYYFLTLIIMNTCTWKFFASSRLMTTLLSLCMSRCIKITLCHVHLTCLHYSLCDCPMGSSSHSCSVPNSTPLTVHVPVVAWSLAITCMTPSLSCALKNTVETFAMITCKIMELATLPFLSANKGGGWFITIARTSHWCVWGEVGVNLVGLHWFHDWAGWRAEVKCWVTVPFGALMGGGELLAL